MRVKIVKATSSENYYDSYGYDTITKFDDLTEWEEVNETKYKQLMQQVTQYNASRHGDTKFILLAYNSSAGFSTINEFDKFYQEFIDELKEKEKIAEKARQARLTKQQKDKEAKKAAKEKKQLEDLLKKYGQPKPL